MDEKLINFEANFSVLDRYGENVTENEFITNPAIGRDKQIKELILVLLTPEKSAILIGKPGIGKTAIVEGLAYRIQKNDIPDALKGYTIINIKTASLLGTMPSGESKVQKMIDELKKREKVILFIDEIHMLIGSTDSSSLDFANIFKEGLGRGSIKVIGATTTEEYERYILRDKAFTRRFQKIEVPEPTREETIKIMMGTLPKFEKQTARKMKYTPFIQERIMSFIVDITSEYKRIFALGSRYPDVCLTLLKQAFSYTVYDNREYMDIFDIRKAIENSKNIYPDVIKKELPRFDKEFNDIILEEKGEKPVEEWRKEIAPTRYEQEAGNSIQNNDELKKLNTIPVAIDKRTLDENKPVKTILSEKTLKKFAKIGPTAISRGFNEKFNRNNDSKSIDNLLLSSGIEIIKKNEPTIKMPKTYTVTAELKPGGADKLLLGGEISNTMDEKKQEKEDIKYKSDNIFDKQIDSMGNTLILDNIKEQARNSNDNSNKNYDITHNQNEYLFGVPMYDTRNNIDVEKPKNTDIFGQLMSSGNNPKISREDINNNDDSTENSSRKNNEYLFGAPMYDTRRNIELEKPKSTDIFGQLMSSGNNPKISREDINNNDDSTENSSRKNNEYLFGAPMYDTRRNIELEKPKSTDIFGQLMSSGNNPKISREDINNNDDSTENSSRKNNEYLFGAPMYDTRRNIELEKPKSTDIFGQLMSSGNNPKISREDINNNDDSTENSSRKNNEYLFGAPMYDTRKKIDIEKPKNTDIFGQLINPENNIRISNGNLIDMFPNIGENNNNDSIEEKHLKPKKWKFLYNADVNNLQNNSNEKYNQEFNTLGRKESNNAKFINFNDLNNGKISYKEANSAINLTKLNEDVTINNRNNKIATDLTLDETEKDDDNYFDDFFED